MQSYLVTLVTDPFYQHQPTSPELCILKTVKKFAFTLSVATGISTKIITRDVNHISTVQPNWLIFGVCHPQAQTLISQQILNQLVKNLVSFSFLLNMNFPPDYFWHQHFTIEIFPEFFLRKWLVNINLSLFLNGL